MNERGATAAEAHALFERVIDLPADERAAVLDAACAGRPDLRARIESLLEIDAETDSVLDRDPEHLLSLLLDDEDAADVTIGPYRVMSELGRGGMGVVYLAKRADGEFEKQVALKLVKRGMDTDEILARFRHERRILASLEHPNIARLYDGGASADGRPYLVMELVRGERITSYCDHHRLTIDERLTLFRTICAAVQHAHQKLVVHRDLKPSNILVSEDGTPTLLDFGIAKLLGDADDDTPHTRTGLRMLTPEYAAPEQMRGMPATTATDVYSLGAVLYELLAGRRPFEGRTPGEMDPDRMPEPPSAAAARIATDNTSPGRAVTAHDIAHARSTTAGRLRRRLQGDLDTITLHALEPDPSQRYGSVQQLLDDIERHMDGLPVQTRAPTFAYRARKFVRRHRSGIAAAAIILLTLTGGLAATLWQARQAALERDAAQRARSSSDQVATFLLNMFDSADPLGIRSERTDTLRVRQMVDRGAVRVREELADQPRLQADMLTLLGRVYTNLGDFERAEEMLTGALDLPPGDNVAYDPLQRRALPLGLMANAARQQGEFERADSLIRQVLAIYEDTRTAPDTSYASILSERGLVLTHLGEYDDARSTLERALALITKSDADGTPLHAITLGNLASLHFELGEYAEATNVFHRVLEIQRDYLPADHPRLASTLNNLGTSVQSEGRFDEAEPLLREAIDIGIAGLGPDHAEVGTYLQNLAILLDELQRYEEAEPLYRDAIRSHEVSLGRTNVFTALLLRNFALNRYTLGELDEAESLLREALASMHAGLGADHLYTAVSAAALGRVLIARGDLDEAAGHITGALRLLEAQLPPEHTLVQVTRRDLGTWHSARGDFAAAEPLLQTSYAALAADRGIDHPYTRETRLALRQMYLAWGRPDRAGEYAEQRASAGVMR
ncbi:MAG TPA: tetratricopeptide repeat protein [Longimicrobiales bacterium]|nr:tetratricopeptide repeat protein [Longimicrobiales bacterium]